MKQIYTAMLCTLLMILPVSRLKAELRGTFIDEPRVIYLGSSSNGAMSTFSNNSDDNYLIQSMVREMDPKSGLPTAVNAPFIVIPPLGKVNAHSSQVLKILRTGGDFPKDRESVFFLNVRLLPSEKENSAPNNFVQMKVIMTLAVKLFYRPKGLPKEGVAGAVKQLQVSVKEDTVTLTNPSPFWITLQTLKVNSFAMPVGSLFSMVPPLSQQSWSLPSGKALPGSHVTVLWRAIDEFGLNTDEESRSVVVSGSR
ncbi:molecular chaperone [Photorhabdus heterorhabditis]|uniref:Molecular chaperone n=1 Tax=Photorhabdus heterorhabditis TaxID=880156 RepID=A0A5B0XAM5_9GAMM|nr:molecular chaperone [Photorhabdus heterorhabditis]KAA1195149.1 molecular chaperone [Photorhabdus heterorhabditis]